MRSLSAPSNEQTTSTLSPKRKRGPSVSDPTTQALTEVQPFAPRLDTSAFPPSIAQQATEQALVGSESPRTRVAHQLENLQLRGSLPALSFTAGEASPSAATAPKKAKHAYDDTSRNDFERYLRQAVPSQWEAISGKQRSASIGTIDYLEVAETPQAASNTYSNDSDRISPPPPSSSPSVRLFLSARSPDNTAKTPRSSSPLPSSAFTWQDSEITGHLVNPLTDPEDDGEGINGIGFRPTAAQAEARMQKRKKQVMEWRAREAREARQRRSDRRRAGRNVASDGEGRAEFPARRMVRFA